MDNSKLLVCPICHNNRFIMKYEASHIYSYVFDSDAPGQKNKEEFLSFLYDNRELTNSDQYVECQSCGAKFPCNINVWGNDTSLRELQEAINKLGLTE
ncbi:MAG TPA: hypothetical protein VM577_02705 [Anaerovoracaceae bacterium]|nr:hypothetical protein [Anaerovoracaceae bacterium]